MSNYIKLIAYSAEKPKRRILYAAVELLSEGKELTVQIMDPVERLKIACKGDGVVSSSPPKRRRTGNRGSFYPKSTVASNWVYPAGFFKGPAVSDG